MLDHIPVTIQQQEIVDFCQRHHIMQLAFFGSALRDDFQSGSDIDVLVQFHPDHIPGLAFFGMQAELSQILGHPVDLNTLQFIAPIFANRSSKKPKSSMTKRDTSAYFRHMLTHAQEVAALTRGKTRADLYSDRLLNLALVRPLEIVGEAANRIPIREQERHPQIP